jgi:phosphoglycolate phosphatase
VITTVLFDLDGTLIHSSPGVLETFRETFAREGVTPVQAVDERVIGPPLLTTIERLTGITDAARVEELARTFRGIYDAVGALVAEPYPGLLEVLDALVGSGRRAYIVTNKRISPARRIAEHLGMTPRLGGVYALDSYAPPAPRKRAVVERVLHEHAIDPALAVMVGDSVEDGEAAAGNGVRFIAATYGYGSPLGGMEPAAVLHRLTDLPAMLAHLDAV